jgi:adenylate cyclase
MISVERRLLDSITETFHNLCTGKVPPPVSIPDGLPDNEIHQLITFINRFLADYAPFTEAMDRMSRGDLDASTPSGRMAVVQSFKALQSNLRHLTWKTQQIAAGDFGQKVDFMGDFSSAFNSMTLQLKESYEKLVSLNSELDRRNLFIRKTFGRYTSDEIVEAVLDEPDGLRLGGEKREVAILMSDLRGFTALTERLEASEVVALMNNYLTVMIEVIQQRKGIIDDIIGDAILVFFGAPLAMEEAKENAACCALEMQKSMAEVNEHNLRQGWPEVEMGIGLHSGETVVGNIGSTKRSKYGVVGRPVNMTARIESFTVGRQVLASPDFVRSFGGRLILGDKIEVHGKGMREALSCRMLLGHRDHPELSAEKEGMECVLLAEPMPVWYVPLTDKHIDEQLQQATLFGLSQRQAMIGGTGALTPHTDIMLRLESDPGEEDAPELYAKVIRPVDEPREGFLIHFTSVSHGMQERISRLTGGSRNT